jgi:transposase
MANIKAREIVEAGERKGLSHQEMAELCGVSIGTIARWKMVGRARTRAIAPLENYLGSDNAPSTGIQGRGRKYLDEASLEDLAQRARELGFRITFTDVGS